MPYTEYLYVKSPSNGRPERYERGPAASDGHAEGQALAMSRDDKWKHISVYKLPPLPIGYYVDGDIERSFTDTTNQLRGE